RVGRPHVDIVLGRDAGDGDHRRHEEPPRTGARRTVLHSLPRISFDLNAELAALFRPFVCRVRCILAHWTRRSMAAPERAVAAADNPCGGDGRTPYRTGLGAAGISKGLGSALPAGAGWAR